MKIYILNILTSTVFWIFGFFASKKIVNFVVCVTCPTIVPRKTVSQKICRRRRPAQQNILAMSSARGNYSNTGAVGALCTLLHAWPTG